MTREDEKQLLADLVFANQQLRDNLRELQKFDKLTQKVSELEKIDTAAIAQKINDANIDKFIKDIAYRINLNLTEVFTKTSAAQRRVEEAGDTLKNAAIELKKTSSNLMELDVIAKSVTRVENYHKSYKNKSWYIGLAVAIFTGIFTGGVLVYSKSTVLGEATPWLEFATQNNAVVERNFETGDFAITIPAGARDYYTERGKNGKDIIYIQFKKR